MLSHGRFERSHDCVVVGAGPAGLAAGLALAAQGLDVVLIGERPAGGEADTRTAALFDSSIAMLRRLGAWAELSSSCQPLRGIRIVDDTGGLLRAPEVLFRASEVGLDAFGWNVPNAALAAALWRVAERAERLTIRPDIRVTGLEIDDAAADVIVADGTRIATRLVVAADGKSSLCRSAAAIETRGWSYDQAAITALFEHGRAHGDISTEFQRRAGPCTTVPLPGLRSSLVWVERTAEAARLAALDADDFRAALEDRLQGLLGTVRAIAGRKSFALSGLSAARMGQRRVALVGEAGHVMPPIGAQGLNLGLRDGAWIAELAGAAVRRGEDPGSSRVLADYAAARAADVGLRTAAVDVLNRSLLAGLVPLDLARGFGLHVLSSVPALKRSVMRQGMAAGAVLPGLMQAET